MAVIIKCSPPEIDAECIVTVTVPPYRGTQPVVGEQAFLWTAETEGGEGLARRGEIRSVSPTTGKDLTILLALTDDRPQRPLTKAMLQPHRDSREPSPIASLAWKLYGHSLQKVAELDAEEVQFLRDRFRPFLRDGV